MKEKRLLDLVQKYLEESCTEEEKNLVETWYAQFNMNSRQPISNEQLLKVSELMHEAIFRKNKPVMYLKIFRIAAACIILVGLIGVGLYFYGKSSNYQNNNNEVQIGPGSEKAVLMLADGKNITLENIEPGQIALQTNSNVVKLDNGLISYHDSIKAGNIKVTPLYNTLTVPKGGEFRLILADGSKIWINSASVLKYPVSFIGQKKREIYLSGEAYFEIAHDTQHPFIVRNERQITKVLGTHFNINAYPENATIKTTLLQGRVQVNSLIDKDSCILLPGTQSILEKTIKLHDVNAENETDWKDGYFIFNKESLNDILNRLARWYNVDIVFKNDLRNIQLDGIISRNTILSDVLTMLSTTKKVHFEIHNRIVYVTE